jgi:hypothetical protein
MNERLVLMGRLEETRLQAERIKLKMEGLRDAVRGCLPPFEAVENLMARIAAQQAIELAALQVQYRDLLEIMAAMRRDLGME